MMKTLRFFSSVLFLAIFLGGCLSPTLPEKPSPAVVDFSPQALNNSDFAQEIEKLTVISRAPETSVIEKAEAHRRLAILHLTPRNPERDFQSAVDELGKFLEIAPQQLDQTAASSWAIALKSGEEYQNMEDKQQILKNKIGILEKSNSQLTKEKKELNAANVELQKTIERLKKLDLSLEKKRRNFR